MIGSEKLGEQTKKLNEELRRVKTLQKSEGGRIWKKEKSE